MSTRIEYTLKESVTAATMSKKPLIVVEGMDDICFYKKIDTKRRCRILSSEIIKDSLGEYYTPGCEGVIKITKDVFAMSEGNSLCLKYFLGIIDADLRCYIDGQDIQLPNLFKLKYYSYESHFTSSSSIRRFIQYITNATSDNISDDIIDLLVLKTNDIIHQVYIAALEVLKGRCDNTYHSLINYDTKPEKLFQKSKESDDILINTILKKEEELECFARYKNISFMDCKKVIKGKWYLYVFTKEMYKNISELSTMCQNGEIKQCDYCINGKKSNCVWKKKIELQRGQLANTMIEINIDFEPELQYIKEKIDSIGEHTA